jgi:hypothetical protein
MNLSRAFRLFWFPAFVIRILRKKVFNKLDIRIAKNSLICSVAKVQFSSVQGVNSPNQNQNQVYKVRTRTEPN